MSSPRLRWSLFLAVAFVLAAQAIAAAGRSAMPSGQIVFSDDVADFDLFVRSLADSGEGRELSSELVSEVHPSLSPDGTKVLVSRAGDLFVRELDGSSAASVVTGPERDVQPSWSPDGSSVAFIREPAKGGAGDVFVARVDGTDVRRVTFTTAFERTPDWSPDGRSLVIEREGKIVRIDLPTGAERRLAGSSSALRPRWSPDGAFVTFMIASPSIHVPSRVAVVAADGTTPERSLAVGAWPEWLPDGRIVYATASATRSIRLDGAGSELVSTRPVSYDWTTDGAVLVESRDISPEPRFYGLAADGSALTRMLRLSGTSAALSPDGQWIAFTAHLAGGGPPRDEVRVARIGSRTAQRIGSGQQPSWSASGRFLVYSSRRGLVVARADGTAKRLIPHTGWQDLRPSFSPRGDVIAFTRTFPWPHVDEIWTVSVQGGRPHRLLRNARDAVWSADARLLAFVRETSNRITARVWTARRDGSRPRRVTGGQGTDWGPAWSPDGRWLAFASDRRGPNTTPFSSNLWIVGRDGSGLTMLWELSSRDPQRDRPFWRR